MTHANYPHQIEACKREVCFINHDYDCTCCLKTDKTHRSRERLLTLKNIRYLRPMKPMNEAVLLIDNRRGEHQISTATMIV